MFDRDRHSEAGAKVIELVDEVIRLRGRMLMSGRVLWAGTGISGMSQGVVLVAVVCAEEPPTVARIARSLGFTRQAIQRTANELEVQGYLVFEDNPHHAKAKRLRATEKGVAAYIQSNKVSAIWADRVGTALGVTALVEARKVLRQVRQATESTLREPDEDEAPLSVPKTPPGRKAKRKEKTA